MKKINAILTILIYALLIAHSFMMSLSMGNLINFNVFYLRIGRVLFIVIIIHALISIRFCKGHKIDYVALNKGTLIQRISGVLMLVLIILHHNHYINKNVLAYILELALAFIITAHLRFSGEKALITLGIENKLLSRIIMIFSILMFISFVYGLTVFFW